MCRWPSISTTVRARTLDRLRDLHRDQELWRQADAPDELARAIKPAPQQLHQLASRRGVQDIDIDERYPGCGMAGPQPDVDAGPTGPPLDRLCVVRI